MENLTSKNKYFLGVSREDKERVYMPKPSWDCDWYWGFGYLDSAYTHTHFDSCILDKSKCSFDAFKDYFETTPLTDDDIWILCDYMKSFYTLKKTAELFKHGNSWQTERATIDKLKDLDLYNKINHELLPELFKKIDELFNK